MKITTKRITYTLKRITYLEDDQKPEEDHNLEEDHDLQEDHLHLEEAHLPVCDDLEEDPLVVAVDRV